MENLLQFVSPVFILITFITVLLFFLATNKNKLVLSIIFVLAIVQAILGVNGFYLKTDTVPPRLVLMLLPSVLLIILAFSTKKGKAFIDSINIKTYTYLHTIRIGVEFVILWLFLAELMPKSMTFEGRNFDIISGITASFIAYYGFKRKVLSKKVMILWNVLCLVLVLQVVITGIFSVESVFQQLSFDTPNKAILYFPYVWLPGIIVPIVIFGHLVSIRQLRKAE